jgi:folate-binding Fe-S cluster repair protein YgfZ
MKLFETEKPDRAAIYTGFLNVKGKIMFDAFRVQPKLACQDDKMGEIEYWIDVEKDNDAPALIKHLNRYALRKKV